MTISSFSSLKLNRTISGIPSNTNDLINGLFLTINTTYNDFDYANAYEILPEVVSKLYECIGSKPFSLKKFVKFIKAVVEPPLSVKPDTIFIIVV